MFTSCQQNCLAYQGFVTVFNGHIEYNGIEYKVRHSSDSYPSTIINLFFFSALMLMPISPIH